jgi:hypothetical protein
MNVILFCLLFAICLFYCNPVCSVQCACVFVHVYLYMCICTCVFVHVYLCMCTSIYRDKYTKVDIETFRNIIDGCTSMLLKDIFGKPREGIHKYRFLGVAFIDTFFLLVIAFLLSFYTKKSFFTILLVLFLFGIFCHYILSVDTTINRFLTGKSLVRNV